MSVAAKTRLIKSSRNSNVQYHIAFKKTTPKKIFTEISLRYSKYLEQEINDQLIDISTTDWFKSMDKKMQPNDYLKNLREAHGFTQKQLGEKMDTNAAHISDYETGQRSISKAMAKRLAGVFKVNAGMFI